MKVASYCVNDESQIGALIKGELFALDRKFGSDLLPLLQSGADASSLQKMIAPGTKGIDPQAARFLPPLKTPPKIFCVGLNYAEHTRESRYEQPSYPTIFSRFATSLVGHGAEIRRPLCSDSLDFEGEMAVVLGRGGKHVPVKDALSLVFGYSVFNDGSVREYQTKSPQWTMGKNFDQTGGFGPWLVTADELPAGGKGLDIETRLNGKVMQSANTDHMIFDVASLISTLSEAITLQAGDVIVSGTPAGIGWAREPKVLMRHGDVCEVNIQGIGTLRNSIADEVVEAASAKAA